MGISNYIPPTTDFSNGYVVQPSDWNSNFDGIATYLNGTIVPAINSINTASNAVNANVCNARMTLVTGAPFNMTDVQSAPNLYITACGGNWISLYNTGTSTWVPWQFTSDIVISAPTAIRDLYDVFTSLSGSTVIGTLSGYNTQAVTNASLAVGFNVVLSVANTANILPGDIVTVQSASAEEECCVLSVNTNVSVTVDWISTAYATPITIRTNTPIQPISLLNGVYVMTSDNTKRYMGTVFVNNNTFWDCGFSNSTNGGRFVANHYNRIQKPIWWENQNTGQTLITANSIACGTGKPGNATSGNVTGCVFVTTPSGSTIVVNRAEGTSSQIVFMFENISGTYWTPPAVTTANPGRFSSPQYSPFSLWFEGGSWGQSASFAHQVSTKGRQFIWDMVANTSGTTAAFTRTVLSTFVANSSALIWC